MDRRSAPPPDIPRSARYITADYADRSVLREVFRTVDRAVDLAYATVPQTSYADPIFDIIANLPPSVGLLEEAAAARLERLLIVSSGGTVYGPTERLPIREDWPTYPVSPYGITKLTIEKYALMYQRLQGLPVTIVRPANAFGPGQRPFTGQGFIATAIATVLKGDEVPLYGGCETLRDYIHVDDVARGIVAALDRGNAGEIYNVGTGVGRSTAEVLEVICDVARARGHSVRVKRLPPRAFDVPANVLDSSKLQACSAWRPLVPFNAGLVATWEAMTAGSGTRDGSYWTPGAH
jgi:UDP-glucose 4-epimerase